MDGDIFLVSKRCSRYILCLALRPVKNNQPLQVERYSFSRNTGSSNPFKYVWKEISYFKCLPNLSNLILNIQAFPHPRIQRGEHSRPDHKPPQQSDNFESLEEELEVPSNEVEDTNKTCKQD